MLSITNRIDHFERRVRRRFNGTAAGQEAMGQSVDAMCADAMNMTRVILDAAKESDAARGSDAAKGLGKVGLAADLVACTNQEVILNVGTKDTIILARGSDAAKGLDNVGLAADLVACVNQEAMQQ